MSDSTGQWRGEGSGGPGHVQQVIVTQQMRIDSAWRAYTGHIRSCEPCGAGVDCPDAVALRTAWRELVPRA